MPELPPEMPFEDATQRWKNEADERDRQRAAAKAELRKAHKKEVEAYHNHEIALAKANGSGGVDWAVVLSAISDGLNGLRQRIEAIEQVLEQPETEVLNLPLHLAPRHGPATGWPVDAGVHYSPPLLTKSTHKLKAPAVSNHIAKLSAAVEKRLSELERTIADQTKMQRDILALKEQCSALQQGAQMMRDRLADFKTYLDERTPKQTEPVTVTHYHVNE
jgi:hypothetical protein